MVPEIALVMVIATLERAAARVRLPLLVVVMVVNRWWKDATPRRRF